MVKDWDKFIKDESARIDRERLEKFKRASRVTDATPLFKEAIRIGESGTDAERDAFRMNLQHAMDSVGAMLLERASLDGTLPVNEWDVLVKKGFSVADIGVVLTAYYAKVDGQTPKGEQVAIMTHDGTILDNNRVYILKKFDINIINTTMMKDLDNDPKFLAWKKEKGL